MKQYIAAAKMIAKLSVIISASVHLNTEDVQQTSALTEQERHLKEESKYTT